MSAVELGRSLAEAVAADPVLACIALTGMLLAGVVAVAFRWTRM